LAYTYIFQKLAEKGRAEGIDDDIRQRDTRTWFREAASQVKSVNKKYMMNDKDNTIDQITANDIGRMTMFFYDPKHKKTLPYYDTFPLIFPISFNPTGFHGINLHYLAPVLRAKLMNAIYKTVNNKKYDETTKLNISYSILKSASKYKYFEPCIKQYLRDHVQSKFLNIPPRMWDAALMLPTARFQKASKETVWKKSEAMI
jgi:hypothetical protein